MSSWYNLREPAREVLVRDPEDRVVKVGFVGWRGMVGLVLVERMRAERDFAVHRADVLQHFAAGGAGPDFGLGPTRLHDASDVRELRGSTAIMSCQAATT